VPDWIATALKSPDVHVRLHALDRWVQQGRTGSVDPLMHALNDRDERVQARALALIEQDWVRAQAAEK
jgi:HEAT repeat protein